MNPTESLIRADVQEALALASFTIIQKHGLVAYPYEYWENVIKEVQGFVITSVCGSASCNKEQKHEV